MADRAVLSRANPSYRRIVQMLFDGGVDRQTLDSNGSNTFLYTAVHMGDASAARFLLSLGCRTSERHPRSRAALEGRRARSAHSAPSMIVRCTRRGGALWVVFANSPLFVPIAPEQSPRVTRGLTCRSGAFSGATGQVLRSRGSLRLPESAPESALATSKPSTPRSLRRAVSISPRIPAFRVLDSPFSSFPIETKSGSYPLSNGAPFDSGYELW